MGRKKAAAGEAPTPAKPRKKKHPTAPSNEEAVVVEGSGDEVVAEPEWEQVEAEQGATKEQPADDGKIPSEGMTLELAIERKKVRDRATSDDRFMAQFTHNAHALCFLAHAYGCDLLASSVTLQAHITSIVPKDVAKQAKKITPTSVAAMISWFAGYFTINRHLDLDLPRVTAPTTSPFFATNPSSSSFVSPSRGRPPPPSTGGGSAGMPVALGEDGPSTMTIPDDTEEEELERAKKMSLAEVIDLDAPPVTIDLEAPTRDVSIRTQRTTSTVTIDSDHDDEVKQVEGPPKGRLLALLKGIERRELNALQATIVFTAMCRAFDVSARIMAACHTSSAKPTPAFRKSFMQALDLDPAFVESTSTTTATTTTATTGALASSSPMDIDSTPVAKKSSPAKKSSKSEARDTEATPMAGVTTTTTTSSATETRDQTGADEWAEVAPVHPDDNDFEDDDAHMSVQPTSRGGKRKRSEGGSKKERDSDGEGSVFEDDDEPRKKKSKKSGKAKGKEKSDSKSKYFAEDAKSATGKAKGKAKRKRDDAEDEDVKPASARIVNNAKLDEGPVNLSTISERAMEAARATGILDDGNMAKRRKFSHDPFLQRLLAAKSTERATVLWCEVYDENDNRWIPCDLVRCSVDEPEKYSNGAPYVAAFEEGAVKDVTQRYTRRWSYVRAKRAQDGWWEATLRRVRRLHRKAVDVERDEIEDVELENCARNEALPTSVSDYKNHPVYALEKHLGKYQVIHPKTPVLGQFKGEPVYPRENVHTLHTLIAWRKEARVVREGEVPFKGVATSKLAKPENQDKPAELYGFWQTDPYKPPVAENGKVPRSEHGDVELYTEGMLPVGTVHLDFPDGKLLCRRLGIDYAEAHVGFEFRGGKTIPRKSGFVVCTEFLEVLREGQAELNRERAEKARQAKSHEVTLRWAKLVSAMLTRYRLRQYYQEEAAQASRTASSALELNNGDDDVVVPTAAPLRPGLDDPRGHVHVFPPSRVVCVDADNGVWSKSCACGFSVEYEMM